MAEEVRVTVLPVGESRQYDAKGEPLRPSRLRKNPGGKAGLVRLKTITFGCFQPEPEVYTRRDD